MENNGRKRKVWGDIRASNTSGRTPQRGAGRENGGPPEVKTIFIIISADYQTMVVSAVCGSSVWVFNTSMTEVVEEQNLQSDRYSEWEIMSYDIIHYKTIKISQNQRQ